MGFRQLAVMLASDPRIAADGEAITQVLRSAADISGALDFVLLDADRRFVASATGADRYVWKDDPFVHRALDGALGRRPGISPLFGRRVFYYAAPVFSPAGPVTRVVVVVIDLEAIEADFRGSNPAVYMTDRAGLIYFSNRSELIFRDRQLNPSDSEAQGTDQTVAPFVDAMPRSLLGYDVWRVAAGRYLPSRALHVERDLPVIGMHAEALIDLRAALNDAWLQAGATAAVFLLFGTVIFVVVNQRRVLARANAALEDRVGERTLELSAVNVSLRSEIAERKEAERALKQAQQDLIQVGKLSALGKMSAGISHELNQPLMAIQSFADNAAIFVERGQQQTAASNMRKVGDLARRMARIIRNFRAFARQEKDTVHRVDLVQAVRGALELAAGRIENCRAERGRAGVETGAAGSDPGRQAERAWQDVRRDQPRIEPAADGDPVLCR